MTVAELAGLPVAEKLRLMEALWDDVGRSDAEARAIPEWHRTIVTQRAAAVEAGTLPVAPWAEVKARLRRATNT